MKIIKNKLPNEIEMKKELNKICHDKGYVNYCSKAYTSECEYSCTYIRNIEEAKLKKWETRK